MSLFTGAAILGSALAAAGGSVAAAKMASGASQNASDKSVAAAQEALDFTKGQKAKQEAAYAPFGALGQQAAGMLPGLARQAPTVGPPAAFTTQPRATAPMPQGAPLSQMGGPQQPMQQPGAGMPMAGPMVLLQGPDGSTKSVPQAQAAAYIARGAKQVGV